MVKVPHRLYLSEDEMPKQWYNLRADMKELPDPMINPGTMKPAAVEDLYPVFCEELAKQEMDQYDPLYRYSGRNSGDVQNLPSVSVDPRLQSGKGAEHPGEDLL